jgi:hypothetical protein
MAKTAVAHGVALIMVAFLWSTVHAEADLENLYLRRAVKDFVAKKFDDAIGDLQQVLAANSENAKARKLMAKCYVKKAEPVSGSQPRLAKRFYTKALEFDSNNVKATQGLQRVAAAAAAAQRAAQSTAQAASQAGSPQQSTPRQPATPAHTAPPSTGTPTAPIVIAPQGLTDSNQTKVISGILENFSKQQELLVEQIESSREALEKTESGKDKYLEALVEVAEKGNATTKQIMLVAGAVALGVILIIVCLFLFVFYRYSKASELRAIQSSEAVAALLAAPSAGQAGARGTPLLIQSPQGDGSGAAQEVSAMDSLDTDDPVKRADAVESVAAEILEPKEISRLEKIKKLEALLKDGNNRVRANAAKALYEIDKEASLQTLRGMLQETSKRMRASAVWALGEIGSEEALELLVGLDDEEDEIVTYNIKVALNKIKTTERFPLSGEQQQQIDGILEKYAEIT